MRAWRIAVFAGFLVLVAPLSGVNAGTKVAVTIKPVHALVAGIMSGIDSPSLIIDGTASPHANSLKPSKARAIHGADVLVRVARTIEPFSEKIIAALDKRVRVVTIAEIPGLHLLERRTGATFGAHDHGTHAGHDHHKHDAAMGHGDMLDGHVWLDPGNAKMIVHHITGVLSELAPEHAAQFRENAQRLEFRIDKLSADLEASLQPVRGKPFVVFHDAYQYFEKRFGLAAAGAIVVRPDVPPGAARLTRLRKHIASLGAACVFAEPQFRARVIDTVVEGTGARAGVLDPIGADLENGPELYFKLMRNLANGFRLCLGGPS